MTNQEITVDCTIISIVSNQFDVFLKNQQMWVIK